MHVATNWVTAGRRGGREREGNTERERVRKPKGVGKWEQSLQLNTQLKMKTFTAPLRFIFICIFPFYISPFITNFITPSSLASPYTSPSSSLLSSSSAFHHSKWPIMHLNGFLCELLDTRESFLPPFSSSLSLSQWKLMQAMIIIITLVVLSCPAKHKSNKNYMESH